MESPEISNPLDLVLFDERSELWLARHPFPYHHPIYALVVRARWVLVQWLFVFSARGPERHQPCSGKGRCTDWAGEGAASVWAARRVGSVCSRLDVGEGEEQSSGGRGPRKAESPLAPRVSSPDRNSAPAEEARRILNWGPGTPPAPPRVSQGSMCSSRS